MNYAEEIIKLVPQIRNESSLKSLYGFTKGIKAGEDKQPVAASQPDKKTAVNTEGAYRQFILELLDDVSSIKTLRFVYSYLQVHIRRKEELKAIVRTQYEEK